MGSFRKRGGKIEYRFTYKDAFGQPVRRSVTGQTEEECLAKSEAFMAEQRRAEEGIYRSMTIPEILRKEFASDFAANRISEATYDMYLEILEHIVSSSIGRIPVADVSLRQIEEFLIEQSRFSQSVLQRLQGQLRRAFRVAKECEAIEKDPMQSMYRKVKAQKGTKKVMSLTRREQEHFERILTEHRVPKGRNDYRLQLLIELYSGLRMGEINALRPEDIDLEGTVIHVGATITRGLGDRVYRKEHPKTREGNRSVPISGSLRPYLETALERIRENPLGLVFYDHIKNDVISTQQVNNFFLRILAKAGLESRGQHALRHTFATRCIEAGVPAEVLKVWLGHTDIRYTLDTYADVFSELDHSSVARLDEGSIVRENRFVYMA